MSFVGIDLGTVFTKMSNGEKFPSGISKQANKASNNILEYGGKEYSMELFNSNIDYDVNINKSLNFNTKLSFYYALGRITKEKEKIYQNVVVGLPANQWKNDETVQQFKDYLNSDIIKFKINGSEKIIQIDNLLVIPEGSSAYYAIDYSKFNSRKVLVLDWGGLTLNELLFDNDTLIDFDTHELGCLKVYQRMSSKLSTVLGIDIKAEDIYDYLINGLRLNGENVNVESIVKDIGLDYCKEVYRNLKLRWNVDTIPYVSMVGGASIMMFNYLKEFISQIELEDNAQQLSALGMEVMI